MPIEITHDGPVATVTINRPEKKNAITLEMREMFAKAFEGLAEHNTTRAVILTGSGGSFCAGMDVGEMGAHDITFSLTKIRRLHRIVRSIMNLRKPVIAAVDGHCVGAGWSFALACDLILASDTAKFAQIFGNIGLVPDAGAVWLLNQQIGTMRAKELVYSGRLLGAEEAVSLGLALETVPSGDLLDRARVLAQSLASRPPLAIGMAKRQFTLAQTTGFDSFLEAETAMQPLMSQTADHKEGVSAFREGRPPDFTGT
ncbi:enoyl-CoA hydratase/isomerase family protein [Croceicoccus ponticola]|uniref:Enoyl-CoA hydratase/isomerase family protein n=1 Tax=Croceicoccus ponticola TaxID=2217664 RepID=A0A437H1Z3_9SPHN|nr:enoyl-CoA hydratase-related protein [Croceicoccus ponticola]RVQ69671.1 enoyl-CoA hydratase/isomerase family protein [Croceicoccus ponticola]